LQSNEIYSRINTTVPAINNGSDSVALPERDIMRHSVLDDTVNTENAIAPLIALRSKASIFFYTTAKGFGAFRRRST
jgi:hypothetical protein